jgi:RsiW-degrading membrane proteinase PrsW (M82 family)
MAKSIKRWDIERPNSIDQRNKRIFVSMMAAVLPLSIGLGFFFTYFYKKSLHDPLQIAASSVISGIGFVGIILIFALYLRVYNWKWSIVCFFESFGLILLLISVKGYLVGQYDLITEPQSSDRMAFVAYIGAASLEEFIKLVVFLTALLISSNSRSGYEMIFLACVSGVSFATIENIILSSAGVLVALQRFIWCTATHTSDFLSGIMILVYMKCSVPKQIPNKWFIYPLVYIVPVGLHGSFDFLIFYGNLVNEPWISRMSIVVGVLSLSIFFAMFYPIRRRQVPDEPTVHAVSATPVQCIES